MRQSSRERMLCTICRARIPVQPFCSVCGNPTAYATQEERIAFELDKWGRAQNGEPDQVIDLTEREKPVSRKRRPAEDRGPPQPVRHAEPWPGVTMLPSQEPSRAGRKKKLHAPSRRSVERWRRVFMPLPNETVGFVKEGKCGPERATIVITSYRVAVIQGSKARWIPLENIDRLELVDGRSVRLVVGGSIEVIAFRHPDRKLLEAIFIVLRHEADLGNLPGGKRHHPDVMQEWMESLTETWKSPFRPIRLWVHRHPAAAAVLH